MEENENFIDIKYIENLLAEGEFAGDACINAALEKAEKGIAQAQTINNMIKILFAIITP